MTPDYSVYLVTDRQLLNGKMLPETVEQAILGGVGVVQLREKNSSSAEFYQLAQELHMLTRRYHVPLIINDRADIALAIDADGVHIGQEDLPADKVRALLGSDKILGVSVHCVAQAIKAQQDGADYLGVGAVFATPTKSNANVLSVSEIKRILAAVNLPVVLIGGLNTQNIGQFIDLKIAGIAVVSAIIGHDNPQSAAREIKQILSRKR
ncbi:thiamine phosphate synthase [Stenoxybacter acetivorans]|uniref:thiamine phosphate synthase n=1 Tax=Stenoxybacter acetivorans TaxID=422441 RepID=UPI000563AAD5|nr:thiamine phosphate synthase [Stenoxybacter acetivorans]